MKKEIWKNIDGYDDLYLISSNGNVKSSKGKMLKPFTFKSGYSAIVLTKNGKRKMLYIHRLVACAFLPNNYNFEEVNHKNGRKNDNNVNNLEWCSRSYNAKHAISKGLISYNSLKKRLKKARESRKDRKYVLQLKDGKIIKKYKSTIIAGKQFSINADRNISSCARGEIKSAYGYQWKYVNY